MKKTIYSRLTALFLIFWILAIYSAQYSKARAIGKGHLIGFIYSEDGTTPVEGAVVKLKNVSTGAGYESGKSDKLGTVKIEAVDEGLYLVGISTEKGDLNVPNLIGIRASETARVSFALKFEGEAKEAKPKASPGGLVKFFLSPVGIAVVIAASAAIIYGVVKLSEKEAEASPFKR